MNNYNTWNKYHGMQEENLLEEETEQLWKDIPGSRNEFRLGRQGLRMYMGITMLVNMTKVTRRVVEYKPMFQMRLYTEDSKTMTISLNTTNAMFLSSALRLLIEDGSLYAYFSKSESCGWYVKRDFLEKPVLANKMFSKELKLDVIPAIDDRRLPGYRFVWKKGEDMNLAYYVTKGEIITLLQRIDSFVNNTPMYVDMFENELMRERLKQHANQMDSIQNTMFNLCNVVNNLNQEMSLLKTNLKNEISVAVNSTVTSVFAIVKQLEKGSSDLKIDTQQPVVSNEPIGRPNDEDDGVIVDVEDAASALLEKDPTNGVLEIDALPQVELAVEEQKPLLESIQYFNNDENIGLKLNIGAVKPQVEDHELTESLQKNEILSIEDIQLPSKSEMDDFAQKVSQKYSRPVVDIDDGRNISLNEIYPDCVHEVLSDELTQAATACTYMPDEKFEMIQQYDLDRVMPALRGLVANGNHVALAHSLLDSKIFNKANLSGMFINRGRIGLPVSSIVYATSLLATAHELIDNGTDKLVASSQCGMHILRDGLEDPHISDDKIAIYNKYFNALSGELTGKGATYFSHRLFTLDKMLLRNAYEFSAFDMKLNSLSTEEKIRLIKALAEVYMILYFADQEHIISNSQTTPHYERYGMVNKQMYIFARAILLNILRCNPLEEIKNPVLSLLADYESVCQRMGWAIERYRDALVSFLVFNSLMKKYVVDIDNIPTGSYIGNTNIYKGIPCEEILAAIYSKEQRSGA